MNRRLTDEEARQKADIDRMTHEDMARLDRYHSYSHPYYKPDSFAAVYFEDKYRELGGMTPHVSRKVGFKWREEE